MIKIIVLMFCCIMLSSCDTVKYIQNNEKLNTVGSFELDPLRANSYWYDGKSYEYNEYQIEVTAEPSEAKVEWAGKIIGTTPFIYHFTGILDRDDYIKIRAMPVDENLPAQETVLRVRTELPRKIHFDLRKK